MMMITETSKHVATRQKREGHHVQRNRVASPAGERALSLRTARLRKRVIGGLVERASLIGMTVSACYSMKVSGEICNGASRMPTADILTRLVPVW